MATVEMSPQFVVPLESQAAGTRKERAKRLHRIASVRRRQGISIRSAARQLGIDVREARNQEDPTSDLSLSDVLRWQRVLGVPLEELFEDSEAPLSRPVMERARLLRIMKTVAAMHEKASSPGMRRMAQMLIEQLTEVMPELAHISPWHSVGQRRSLNELGRAADRCLPDDFLNSPPRFE